MTDQNIAEFGASVSSTPNMPFRTAVASFIGNTIEWYDFYIYGVAAGLVFGTQFFPNYDPVVATLLSFTTYALGCVVRPLGGMVCGYFGDRVGRKSMLIYTLMGMGAATFLIGVLPTYDQLGKWAAVLLISLRLIQGFAVGGEWGGAVLMAVEHAPHGKRGFFGCIPQMSSPVALFLANGMFALLAFMPKEAFLTWGWRIPFLVSIVLVVVGLIFRLRLLESPEFVKVVENKQIARNPVAEVLRRHWPRVLIACGVVLSTVVAFTIQVFFVVSYATQFLGISRPLILNAILIGSALELALLPVFAVLADKIGLKKVGIFGSVLTLLGAFPFFWLLAIGTPTAVVAALCVAMVGASALFAILPAYVAQLFDPRVRYSGISISYNIASGMIGGFSPVVATMLLAWANDPWPIAAYIVAVAALSIIALIAGPKDPTEREVDHVLSSSSRAVIQ